MTGRDAKPEGLGAEPTKVAPLAGQDPRDPLDEVYSLAGFEPLARRAMEPGAFDYVAGGAAGEVSLTESVTAFSRWRFRPRVLVDVSKVDISTEVLGTPVSMPVGLAPTALQRLAHPEGEVASARAAAEAGVVFCLSTLGSRTIEDVGEAASKPRWFQLYVHRDRGISKALIERAEAAGFDALVVTVDLPVVGYRERDLKNRLEIDPAMYTNFAISQQEGRSFQEVVQFLSDPGLTWDDLEWVRERTSLPLVLKGVETGEDAALAVQHGVDAIEVSNHGGRQLDRAVAPLDALEEVVQSVGGKVEVYVDGGVRRGSDVVTALALGARAAFIGRPFLFALAAGGQRGVARALELLAAEIENAMALLGAPDVAEISRAHLTRV
ncbi:MAG TPA: alpha-hydroxy acid oxidase [Actinomycetota bacterium]|jgi:4-hydroxymandelate oxidase|nr:alpha-hydroxy acid oxidase [Actinomycetota bacterium]